MRKLYSILLTLIVLLSITMSVQAFESKTVEKHNCASVSANWKETKGNVATYTYLSVTENDKGTDVYLNIRTDGPGSVSDKSGKLFTKKDVFKVNKKLNSASLSKVKIVVSDKYTGKKETLTVKADWTGGDDLTDFYKAGLKSNNGMFKTGESFNFKGASAKGSINGHSLGVTSSVGMSSFESSSISMEKTTIK